MFVFRTTLLLFVVCLTLTSPLMATCINGGTDATIQAALGTSPNTSVVLCQGSAFSIYNTIQFTANGQKIYTEGTPSSFLDYAYLEVASSSVVRVISGLDRSNIEMRNLWIEGHSDLYGFVRQTGKAMIDIGGEATGQVIDHVHAGGTREWSTISIYGGSEYFSGGVWNGGCTNATITNSEVWNAGDLSIGKWADGISLGCRGSRVANNHVWNATDGGIVVFAAPGSIIENNDIEVSTEALGGINLVDYSFTGDYTGTIVRNNIIRTSNYVQWPPYAFLHVGIAIGYQVWFGGCDTTRLRNGTVTGNQFQGPGFGYAIAVDGTTNWTVTGNTVDGTFTTTGNPAYDGCIGWAAAPGAFKKHGTHATGTYQSNFVEGQLHRAASVTP